MLLAALFELSSVQKSPVEATESPGAHERDQQDTGPQDEHVPGLA